MSDLTAKFLDHLSNAETGKAQPTEDEITQGMEEIVANSAERSRVLREDLTALIFGDDGVTPFDR